MNDSVEEVSYQSSYFAMDLRRSEWDSINRFLDKDNNKFKFAKRYIKNIGDNHVEPEWINEIRGWLN